MKQKQFVAENTALWNQIAHILDGQDKDRRALPALYRRLCQCLALARQRGYSPAIADYLQNLVSDCHRQLYGNTIERPNTLLHWLLVEFPRRVRAEWRLVLVACIAFLGVALATGFLVWFAPHWAYSFMDADQLNRMRQMYQPGRTGLGRGSEGDLMMFGHYIWNNVSIGFRTFAGGIAGGIPALFILAFNGMHSGVIAAWLTKDPATAENFWSFVITHASLELTGLLLTGVAGMRMGLALIHPGRMGRGHSLRAASLDMFPVLVGSSIMIFLAAFIEAFWSAAPSIPANVKYGVGGVCWALVIAFFVFAGRRGN
jgi:uncharacterized membrane protein SpoIIM required for sporulation